MGPELPAEFRLVAACCRWPADAGRDAAVQACASADLDWNVVVRVARQQRVCGLVRPALAAAGVEAPEQALEELAATAAVAARHCIGQLGEAARILDLCRRESVPVMVLKGLPLAQLAYGALTLKHGKDIDLLVAPEDALRLTALLTATGYRVPGAESDRQRRIALRYGHELSLVHATHRTNVEIHWRAADNPHVLDGLGVLSGGQQVAAGGLALPTLADDDLFAYLCVHGAGHGWFRLKWLADLNAFLAGRSDAEVVRLYRRAGSGGAGLHAGQALLLRERILGSALPPELAGELRRSRRLRRLVEIAIEAMIGPDGFTDVRERPAAMWRLAGSKFLLGRGPGYLLAETRLLLMRPEHLLGSRLPEPLVWLSPLLRLFWKRRPSLPPARPAA